MRTPTIFAASAALLLAGSLPATAATRSFKDSRNDGYGHYNIIRVTGTNAPRKFRVRVKFEDLPAGWAGWTTIYWKHNGPVMQVRRRHSGRYKITMSTWRGYPVKCRGIRARYSSRRDLLRAAVPQRCLPGKPRPWRLYLFGGDAAASHADDATRTGPRIPFA